MYAYAGHIDVDEKVLLPEAKVACSLLVVVPNRKGVSGKTGPILKMYTYT